jgi:hypothetical protein
MFGDNTLKLKVIELYHFIFEIAMGTFFFVGITPKLKTFSRSGTLSHSLLHGVLLNVKSQKRTMRLG